MDCRVTHTPARAEQEGSAVLQLVYSDVATNAQKHSMYTEMWGREFALFKVGNAPASAIFHRPVPVPSLS